MINKMTKPDQQIWLDHVNKTTGMDFNEKTVTVFKKVGTEWTWV